MSQEPADIQSRLEQMHALLKQIAIAAVEESSLVSGFRADDVESDADSHLLAPWMSLILVYTEPLRITLTTHFKIRDAGVLASEPLGLSPARVLDSDAVDFMKEFSNLAGGRLKKSIEDTGLSVGMSLPLIMRGFDYLYMNAADERMRFLREWKILGPVTLRCAAMIDIIDTQTFQRLELKPSKTKSGIVDLL